MEERGIKEVTNIGRMGRDGNFLAKLAGRDAKRKVMEAKKKVKSRRERIDDDLIEEDRKVRWI